MKEFTVNVQRRYCWRTTKLKQNAEIVMANTFDFGLSQWLYVIVVGHYGASHCITGVSRKLQFPPSVRQAIDRLLLSAVATWRDCFVSTINSGRPAIDLCRQPVLISSPTRFLSTSTSQRPQSSHGAIIYVELLSYEWRKNCYCFRVNAARSKYEHNT